MPEAAESRHSIQVVSSRTGLSADVIRAWERRYKAITPARSETRRRLYTDDDIERLTLLRRATLTGRRIGEIAGMPLGQLESLVKEDSAAMARVESTPGSRVNGNGARHLASCLEAAMRIDSAALEYQLNCASVDLDLGTLFDGVLSPLLHQLGDQWMCGQLSIAHEHVASALVRGTLDSLRTTFHDPRATETLITTTPAGQHHELGAMKVAVLGAAEGWKSTYLGPNLPAAEIAQAAVELNAAAVALSIVFVDKDPLLEKELETLGQLLPRGATLIVGGNAVPHYQALLARHGARLPGDMQAMRRLLAQLLEERISPLRPS